MWLFFGLVCDYYCDCPVLLSYVPLLPPWSYVYVNDDDDDDDLRSQTIYIFITLFSQTMADISAEGQVPRA